MVVWDIASGTELCAYQLAPGASPIEAAKMLSSGISVNLNGASFKFLTIGQRSIKEWTFYESPEYGLTFTMVGLLKITKTVLLVQDHQIF